MSGEQGIDLDLTGGILHDPEDLLLLGPLLSANAASGRGNLENDFLASGLSQEELLEINSDYGNTGSDPREDGKGGSSSSETASDSARDFITGESEDGQNEDLTDEAPEDILINGGSIISSESSGESSGEPSQDGDAISGEADDILEDETTDTIAANNSATDQEGSDAGERDANSSFEDEAEQEEESHTLATEKEKDEAEESNNLATESETSDRISDKKASEPDDIVTDQSQESATDEGETISTEQAAPETPETVDNADDADDAKNNTDLEEEDNLEEDSTGEEGSSASNTGETAAKEEAAVQADSTQTAKQSPGDTFQSGVFKVVSETGEVLFDFLYDGGWYQGEMAIFSIEGMGNFKVGSVEFIREVSRRALGKSEQYPGYIVISDIKEAGRFAGPTSQAAREGNPNRGEYQGVKEFLMSPGEEFGIMLVPNGTVQEVFENPSIGGDKRPLFSMTASNVNEAFPVGQIADVTGDGHTFAMEDIRVDRGSDRDYDDFVFQVRGAIARTVHLDEVIDPDRDWRQSSEVGRALVEYANLAVNLTNGYLDEEELAAELSSAQQAAIAQTQNLYSYDPEVLAEAEQWVIWVPPQFNPEELATMSGAEYIGPNNQIENTHIWEFPEDISAEQIQLQLADLAGSQFAYPLAPISLSAPSLILETSAVDDLWHLENSDGSQVATNVSTISESVTGNGVTIGIVDDGVDWQHSDLVDNFNSSLSYDLKNLSVWLGAQAQAQFLGDDFESSLSSDFNNVFLAQGDTESQELSANENNAIDPESLSFPGNINLGNGWEGVKSLLQDPESNLVRGLEGVGGKTGWAWQIASDKSRENPEQFQHGTAVAGAIPATASNSDKAIDIYGNRAEGNTIQGNAIGMDIDSTLELGDLGWESDRWGWRWADETDESPENPEQFQHGTAIAGVIAAANDTVVDSSNNPIEQLTSSNSTSVAVESADDRGEKVAAISPDTQWASLSLTAEEVTNRQIANALYWYDEDIDIYNNSWKPGNEPASTELALYDPFANSRYTIAVGALDRQTWYSEPSAPLMVSAPSSISYNNEFGGEIINLGITTTDLSGDSGYNTVGSYTNTFGDAAKALKAAGHWTPILPKVAATYQQIVAATVPEYNSLALLGQNLAEPFAIEKQWLFDLNKPANPHFLTSTITVAEDRKVERVEVVLDTSYSNRGELKVVLISPDGTESVLSDWHPTPSDRQSKSVYTSIRHWGESSSGDWTLRVSDEWGNEVGNWNSWQLKIVGTEKPAPAAASTPAETEPKAIAPKASTPIMAKEQRDPLGNNLPPLPPRPPRVDQTERSANAGDNPVESEPKAIAPPNGGNQTPIVAREVPSVASPCYIDPELGVMRCPQGQRDSPLPGL